MTDLGDDFVIIKSIEDKIQEKYFLIAKDLLSQRNALLNIYSNPKYNDAKIKDKSNIDVLISFYNKLNESYEKTLFNLKKKNIDVYNKIGGWILPEGPSYVPEKGEPENRVNYLTRLTNISNEITQQYMFLQVNEYKLLKVILTGRGQLTPIQYLEYIKNNVSIIIDNLEKINTMINDDVFNRKSKSKGGNRKHKKTHKSKKNTKKRTFKRRL